MFFLSPLESEKSLFILHEIEKDKYKVQYLGSELTVTINNDKTNSFTIHETKFKTDRQQYKLIGYILFVLIAKVWGEIKPNAVF